MAACDEEQGDEEMEEAVHGMRGFFIEKSIRAKIQKKPKQPDFSPPPCRHRGLDPRSPTPSRFVHALVPFALMQNRRFDVVKWTEKNQGRLYRTSPRTSKRLTFRSGSDFSEVKRKRPSVKVKRLVSPWATAAPRFGHSSPPYPVYYW